MSLHDRPLPIRVVDSATREIDAAALWWRANRRAAPGAVHGEIARAFDLLSHHPFIGARAGDQQRLPGIRRFHLRRIHHFIYYHVLSDPPAIEVLAFWHTSRGVGPAL